MRLFKGSNATLAPEIGYDTVCSIEILRSMTLTSEQETAWKKHSLNIFLLWRNLVDSNGVPGTSKLIQCWFDPIGVRSGVRLLRSKSMSTTMRIWRPASELSSMNTTPSPRHAISMQPKIYALSPTASIERCSITHLSAQIGLFFNDLSHIAILIVSWMMVIQWIMIKIAVMLSQPMPEFVSGAKIKSSMSSTTFLISSFVSLNLPLTTSIKPWLFSTYFSQMPSQPTRMN